MYTQSTDHASTVYEDLQADFRRCKDITQESMLIRAENAITRKQEFFPILKASEKNSR